MQLFQLTRKACDKIQKLTHRVTLTGCDDIIIGWILLQHKPHRADVVSRMTPIPPRINISDVEFFLQTELDPTQSASDLTRNKCFDTAWRFVIEEKPIADEEIVGLPCIDGVQLAATLLTAYGLRGESSSSKA
jgi:hypothetical protein